MNAVAVFRTHLWIDTIELVRLPMYSVSTVVFPTLLYLLFGLPYGHSQEASRMVMSSFCAYAVIGVTLFQFGVGIATDRNSPWEQYLRVLPVSAFTRLTAQITAALFFAAGSVTVVIGAAALFSHAAPDPALLVKLVPVLLAGSIPFALLGITIGYWVGRRAALPVANLIYLPMALGGGLWMPPEALPKLIAAVSPVLPSRHYGEVIWAVVRGDASPLVSWFGLLSYTIVFGFTAIWGYRRDEHRNYR